MSAYLFETTADTSTVDELHSVLASRPRRLTLAYFENTTEETASLDDLAEYIVARQEDTIREQTWTLLRHSHLPKLEAVGLVDYDPQTQIVRYRGAPAMVESDEWSRYLIPGRAD